MPYAPGIQDISGQLIAQGMSQAGAARARAIESIGESISGGMKQFQQNQLFTNQALGKFGTGLQDPSFRQYVQQVVNDDPNAPQVPEAVKKAFKNAAAGKPDIYDAALLGTAAEGYQQNQFNKARAQAMQMEALKNRIESFGRLQNMYEGGVDVAAFLPPELQGAFPKREAAVSGADAEEIKGIPLDMTGAQPAAPAPAPAAVSQFLTRIPSFRDTQAGAPAAVAAAPAAPAVPAIPMAAPKAAAPAADSESAPTGLPPLPTLPGQAPERVVKTQYGIFSENVVNQANQEINRAKRAGKVVGAGERARILSSFADQERKTKIEQSEFTDADSARRYGFNLTQSEAKLPYGIRRTFNVKSTPRGTYVIESELSPMTAEEKALQEQGVAFAKVDADLLTKDVNNDKEGGALARESASAVNGLMKVLPEISEETGKSAEFRLNVLSLGKTLGLPVDEKQLEKLDYADSLSNQLMFSWIQKSKGSSSDKETALFRSISPGILKTGAANEALIDILNEKIDLSRKLERNANDFQRRTASASPTERAKLNAEFYAKRQQILDEYDAKLPSAEEFRKRIGVTDQQSIAESAAENAAGAASAQADGRSAAQRLADAEAATRVTAPGPVTKPGRIVRVNAPELTGPLVESDRPEYLQGLRRTR